MKAFHALALLTSLVSGAVFVSNDFGMSQREWSAWCEVKAEPYHNRQPNSTGSLEFDPPFTASKDPWRLTLSLNDFRPYNLDDMPNMDSQQLKLFLTVPESHAELRGLEFCYYTFEHEHPNATSTGRQGEESCEKDLIPQDCRDLLMSGLKNGSCALPKDTDREMYDKCGYVGTSYAYEAMDFTHNACTANDVPYIDRPEGYLTSIDTPDIIFGDDHESARDFTNYDKRVRQTIPIVLVTSWPDPANRHSALGNMQTLCIAASNVTEGSRVPAKASTDDSSKSVESSNPAQSGEPEETATREGAALQSGGSDAENNNQSGSDDDSGAVAWGASVVLASAGVLMAMLLA